MLVLSSLAHASPAAKVYGYVWRGGVVLRDELVEATGLSAASVSRAIASLTEVGLIRARPDVARAGTTGRPTIPIELDNSHHAVIGVHVGRTRTTVAVADLRGRVLESVDLATPASAADLPGIVLLAVAKIEPVDRVIVSAAVIGAWADLGINADLLADRLAERLQVNVVTQDHITAAAAAEHLADGRSVAGGTVYVYGRDTIGFAVVEHTSLGMTISRSARLTHFPSGSGVTCACRATGCLEATVSDLALAQRAVGDGLIEVPDVTALYSLAGRGSVRASDLLHERAMRLGRAAAFVRDMVGCDRVVLTGQAFTSYEPVQDSVLDGFAQATSLNTAQIEFGRRGEALQAIAASTVALTPFAEDPLGFFQAE